MTARLCLIITLSILGCRVLTASAASVPDTPAGRALTAWLDAFNGGDQARIDSFDREHFPALDIDRAMSLRGRSGGFDLLEINKSEAGRIIFHVGEKTGSNEDIGLLILSDSDPTVIATLRFFPMAPGSKYEEVALDAAMRTRLVDAVAASLDDSYVFPDTGKKMARTLKAKDRRGDYKSIVDGEVFAVAITHDLFDISHDKHAELRFSPVAQPPEGSQRSAEADANRRKQMLSANCGFEKLEHLPPNVGYLKFDMFGEPEICGPIAADAFNFVARSDSLIIDLRDNHGGNGDMAKLIASYVFAEPTRLIDTYDRTTNKTTQSWTLAQVPGTRFVGKPIFILTSEGTFSAAEAFSYGLKTLKRATLVGEVTGGGAHMVKRQRLDDHFTLVIPFARSVSPITNSDWEGTGVEPDTRTPAADALTEALRQARAQPLH